MKILEIIPTVTCYHTFLVDLLNELSVRNHEVHLIASSLRVDGQCEQVLDGPVKYHPIETPRGGDVIAHARTSRVMRRLVHDSKPDLIHAHFSAGILTCALARTAAWPVTLGTFQGLRFPLEHGIRRLFYGIAETWSATRMDRVWVLTDDDRTCLGRYLPRGKVEIQRSSGFGCRRSIFSRSHYNSQRVSDIRKRLGLTDHCIVFLFVGRFVHFKGFGQTIRAFLQLHQRVPETRLILVGSRDPMHRSGLNAGEELMLGSESSIIKVGWQEHVSDFYAVSDAFVFPSEREGMPVSVMESLSMGVPVITLDSRGCRNLVRNEWNGLVLHENSVKSISGALDWVVNHPGLWRQFALNAASDADKFDRKNWVEEQISIYERLVRSG